MPYEDTMKNLLKSALTGLAALSFSCSFALAQTAPKPAPTNSAPPTGNASIKVALKAAPEQADWLKVCDEDPAIKKVVCYTTRDFVADNNQPVMALAFYAVKDESRRFVRFLVPLTFMVQPGVRFSTEGLPPVGAKFQICLPQGCFVETDIPETTVAAIKKGANLRIDMQNQLGQEVNFEVPLAGFAKVYDSPGINQETLVKLQQGQAVGEAPPGGEDLKKKAEELMKQRQQAAPGAAPSKAP